MWEALKGCFGKSKDAQINSDIHKDLILAEKAQKREIKILLLGTGESGKSTVFKQMKFLYGNDTSNSVTPEVLNDSKEPCFSSMVLDAQQMLYALSPEGRAKLGIPDDVVPELNSDSKLAQEYLNTLSVTIPKDGETKPNRGFSETNGLSEDLAKAISAVWNDPAVQVAWKKARSKLQVSDSWSYFAEKVANEFENGFGGKNWSPTDEEYLLIRVKTTGVKQCHFPITPIAKGAHREKKDDVLSNKNHATESSLVLVDVGGQKAERRKWMNVFHDVPLVLFVVALSEYDQVMYEDINTNRLQDSLLEFEKTITEQALINTDFILFLNKADLFREKLCENKIPLNASGQFEDAPEGFEFEQGVQWIQHKFEEIYSKHRGTTAALKVHVTTATDSSNAKAVLQAVQMNVIEELLIPFGG